jgi:hypothetical protein
MDPGTGPPQPHADWLHRTWQLIAAGKSQLQMVVGGAWPLDPCFLRRMASKGRGGSRLRMARLVPLVS